MSLQPTILSIAGSDPTGGAGIQADLKTITAIGVYGAAAITCLTIQNARGVQEIKPLPAEFIKAQILAVLADHNVTHIKIGMTGNEEIIASLSRLLDSFSGEVIYDPVLAATSGQRLFTSNTLSSLRQELLPCVSYLTPNSSELQLLGNHNITSPQDAINSAKRLLKQYPQMKGIIVKGGHLNETSTSISDFLIQEDESVSESKRQRIHNPHLHGTGCTYSSALASYLCLENDPITAFQMTGEYMNNIIEAGKNKSVSSSDSNGPLLHFLT